MSWDIRAKDWSDFPEGQKWFAVGEDADHLKDLVADGKITEELDSNGIYYYSINNL